jgi:hypothetical protein
LSKLVVTFETVRKIGLALPDVEEGTSYGTPALKVRGKLFARQHQDGDSLVLRVEQSDREEMMAADPDTYFITDHYRDYPWILVRLSRVRPEALPDLLRMAWRLAGLDARRPAARKKRSRA